MPKAKRILEPFAGSGTTPIVLGQLGVECAYSEANPAMALIIKTKLEVLSLGSEEREQLANKVSALNKQFLSRVNRAKYDTALKASYLSTFGKSIFFDEKTLDNILRIRTLNDEVKLEDPLLGSCLTLAILASLIPSSRLKRAGDLRFKTPKELLSGTQCVLDNISERLSTQAHDIRSANKLKADARFAYATARELSNSVGGDWDGVITSPPYLNGTNYIRNARLELWVRKIYCFKSRHTSIER